jgi:DNA-binding MarR family transcriptional regulator
MIFSLSACGEMLSLTTIAVKPRQALEKAMAEQTAGRKKAPARHSRRAEAVDRLGLGGLDGHLGYFVRRLQLWIFKDFVRTLASLKVKPAQYSVLLLIEANPRASQSAVARQLHIEPARLARMLHGLQERGWVARLASDGRTNALQLTPAGRRALSRVKKAALKHEAQVAARLGQKRRRGLLGLLKDFG